jgi:hypothetical protein
MKIETLKKMIEFEEDKCETISQFKKEVFRLLDLFESDGEVFKIEIPDDTALSTLKKKLLMDNFTSK